MEEVDHIIITSPDTSHRGGDVPDESEHGCDNRLLVGARLPCISEPLQPEFACHAFMDSN